MAVPMCWLPISTATLSQTLAPLGFLGRVVSTWGATAAVKNLRKYQAGVCALVTLDIGANELTGQEKMLRCRPCLLG